MLSCFLTATATTAIYTLSLHDALPISHADEVLVHVEPAALQHQEPGGRPRHVGRVADDEIGVTRSGARGMRQQDRSEEHTSELQSHVNLVCRLLLEKKNRERLNPPGDE